MEKNVWQDSKKHPHQIYFFFWHKIAPWTKNLEYQLDKDPNQWNIKIKVCNKQIAHYL